MKGRESFVSFCLTHLLETDVLGVLSEASSAKLESVLTDDTVVASADAAVKKKEEERRRRRKDNPSVRKEQKKENSKNSFPTGGQAKRGTKIEYETASSSLLCRFFLFKGSDKVFIPRRPFVVVVTSKVCVCVLLGNLPRVRSQAIVSTVRVPDVLVSHACACSCSKFESKFTRF